MECGVLDVLYELHFSELFLECGVLVVKFQLQFFRFFR